MNAFLLKLVNCFSFILIIEVYYEWYVWFGREVVKREIGKREQEKREKGEK
jgi:hypothetical protein